MKLKFSILNLSRIVEYTAVVRSPRAADPHCCEPTHVGGSAHFRKQRGGTMRAAKIIAFCLIVLALTSGMGLLAQTATGEINGAVSDQSGAVVAGATVKLANTNTRIEKQVTTNATGFFVFINV